MLGIESSLPSASRASKRRSSKSFRPSLKAASGLKISTLLMICMGLFMVLIVAVGGLAAYFLQQSG
ncbi:methyl-accepting chemotaxis protein, partial [Alcaligenes pakistanensis]